MGRTGDYRLQQVSRICTEYTYRDKSIELIVLKDVIADLSNFLMNLDI